MQVATWNVNSLKVRLEQVLQWLSDNPVDVLALQETKCTDENFPREAIEAAGWHVCFVGQKTYNGVALISKEPAQDVVMAQPGGDEQKRLIAGTFGNVRVMDVYVPNGSALDSPKYTYKLDWLDDLIEIVRDEMQQYPNFVLTGDFNIAPRPEDTHAPEKWEGNILCSEPERDAFRQLLGLGMTDTFDLFNHPPETFTWWDFRRGGFQRNNGLRIDHILCSNALAECCDNWYVDVEPRRADRPSDHTPVISTFMTVL